MVFTQAQIQDMLSIMTRYQLTFIASQLGPAYLSPSDKAILLASGIDINKFTNSKGVIEHAFLFGILADAVGDERAKKMDYPQFQKFIASKNFIPLTKEEEYALEQVKNRAYTDITNLGARMRSAVSNSVLRNNQQQSLIVQKMIREKTIKAIELRSGARALAADLASASQDWEVDWLRIAYYLTHEAYNTGRAQSILKNYGTDAEIYFDVYPGACNSCKKLYLVDPNDPDSQPIVFKLKDVMANGNNIGRKVADWKPTIGPIHPYCRCTINYKDPNMDWDPEVRAFTKPRKKLSKNPKLQGVKLNIKVTKSINQETVNMLQKAHVQGDIHPNGKWYWESSANGGKGDWRVIKNSNTPENFEDFNGSHGIIYKPFTKIKELLKTISELKKDSDWDFDDGAYFDIEDEGGEIIFSITEPGEEWKISEISKYLSKASIVKMFWGYGAGEDIFLKKKELYKKVESVYQDSVSPKSKFANVSEKEMMEDYDKLNSFDNVSKKRVISKI